MIIKLNQFDFMWEDICFSLNKIRLTSIVWNTCKTFWGIWATCAHACSIYTVILWATFKIFSYLFLLSFERKLVLYRQCNSISVSVSQSTVSGFWSVGSEPFDEARAIQHLPPLSAPIRFKAVICSKPDYIGASCGAEIMGALIVSKRTII